MLKTIRKYNKLLLGVGGTLLLIAFLMPQAIQQLGKASGGKPVGTMDGHKVTAAEFDRASKELRAIQGFYERLSGFGMGFPIALDQQEEVAHWMLLTREAERAGMVGGPDEGAQLLPLFAQVAVRNYFEQLYRSQVDQFMQTNPEAVDQAEASALRDLGNTKLEVSRQAGLLDTDFDQALAKLQGTLRLLNAYRYAERLSDNQTRLIAQRLGDSVIVDSAVLNARRLMDESVEPTPEELAAHFAEFRATPRGGGEFGIGYVLPPRVKVEWIELSPRLMREAISISPITISKHYQQNRDRFPGEFDEEKAAVEAELASAELTAVLNTAEAAVRAEILGAVRPLEQSGEYRVLPADWGSKKPDFVAMADRVVAAVEENHGVTIPTPAVYVRDNGWLDSGMLVSQPGIGSASARWGRQSVRFPQLMMLVRELAGDSPIGLQVGVPPTNLVLEGPDRSRYYFNILDARKESVPDAPSDVLNPDLVVADWKAMRKFRELAGQVDSIASTVETDGLEAYAEGFGEYVPTTSIEGYEPDPVPNVSFSTRGRVTSEGTSGLGGAENSEEVIERVLDVAGTMDPLQPIDELPLSDRIVVVPIPQSLSVFVGEIRSIAPLTREMLPVFVRYAQQEHTRSTFPAGMPMPYTYEILKQRHAFSLDRRSDDEDDTGTVTGGENTEPDAATGSGSDVGTEG